MQQANYQVSSAQSMNERVSMHKSPSTLRHWRMNQARSEEKEKRGRETGKTDVRRLLERKAVQQKKKKSGKLKQSLPGHS